MSSLQRKTLLGGLYWLAFFSACGVDPQSRPAGPPPGIADAAPGAIGPINPPPLISVDGSAPAVKPPLGNRVVIRGMVPSDAPGWFGNATPASGPGAPHRVGGAIYYWSTTVQGVRRGTLDGRDAGDYLTPPEAKGQCVACHTLSRSGKRLTIALPGDLLGLVDVVDTVPPVTFGPSSQGFVGQN